MLLLLAVEQTGLFIHRYVCGNQFSAHASTAINGRLYCDSCACPSGSCVGAIEVAVELAMEVAAGEAFVDSKKLVVTDREWEDYFVSQPKTPDDTKIGKTKIGKPRPLVKAPIASQVLAALVKAPIASQALAANSFTSACCSTKDQLTDWACRGHQVLLQ